MEALRTDEITEGRTLYVEDFDIWIEPRHEALLDEIAVELADPEYQHLVHGELYTKNKGCAGPLCKRALRLWARDYRERRKKPERTSGIVIDMRTRNPGRPRKDDAEYLLEVVNEFHQSYMHQARSEAA